MYNMMIAAGVILGGISLLIAFVAFIIFLTVWLCKD